MSDEEQVQAHGQVCLDRAAECRGRGPEYTRMEDAYLKQAATALAGPVSLRYARINEEKA